MVHCASRQPVEEQIVSLYQKRYYPVKNGDVSEINIESSQSLLMEHVLLLSLPRSRLLNAFLRKLNRASSLTGIRSFNDHHSCDRINAVTDIHMA